MKNEKRIYIYLSFFIFIFTSLPLRSLLAEPEDEGTFIQSTLSLDGKAVLYRILDWDNDGENELLVIGFVSERESSKLNFRKAARIYKLREESQPRLVATYPIENDVSAVAVARPCFDKPYEIFCFSQSEVRTLELDKDRTSICLYKQASFFSYPSSNAMIPYEGMIDLNGDGLTDILYPQPDGYRILTQQAGATLQFNVDQLLKADHPTHINAGWHNVMYYSSRLPILRQVDVNNDGLKDLISFPGIKPLAFVKTHHGEYAPWENKNEEISRSADKIRISVEQILDINGDGWNDMASTLIFGNFGVLESLKTRVLLKYGKKETNLLEQPYTESILHKGVSIIPDFTDINGDGCPDMLLSSVRTDLLSGAVSYFTDELDIHYYLFYFNKEENKFSNSADFSYKTMIKLGELSAEKTIPRIWFHKDLDGNGRRELIRYDHEGLLHILEESEKGSLTFHKDSAVKFRVQPPGKYNLDKIWVHFVPMQNTQRPTILVFDEWNLQIHLITNKNDNEK